MLCYHRAFLASNCGQRISSFGVRRTDRYWANIDGVSFPHRRKYNFRAYQRFVVEGYRPGNVSYLKLTTSAACYQKHEQ
jgi:hypothetical protein